jgi:hypothetical protein
MQEYTILYVPVNGSKEDALLRACPSRGGSKSQEDPNPFVYSMHITDSILPLGGNDLSKGAICSLIQKFGTKKGEVDKTLFSSTNSINSQQLCIIQQLN